MFSTEEERSACGVGFVVSRTGQRENWVLDKALGALACVEHRGACGADRITSDGSGVMTDIPFALLGYDPGEIAVATLFFTMNPDQRRQAVLLMEQAFRFFDIELLDKRRVPTRPDVLGPQARASMPHILQFILARPPQCRSDKSFNELLYLVKQRTRSKMKDAGLYKTVSFASLSTTTIVYKALTQAHMLAEYYPDLRDPAYETRFALFHRRFSTNTRTGWEKAQPFRLIAHNGEINTIASNRSWAYSREQALGLRRDELLTHESMSDSGSLNEMVEALKYRSSIPHVEDILAICMPPATGHSGYYNFWGRAMEPWDGPAFITYADGSSIGARLDRNGFRPCRWTMTEGAFYLASEAGIFDLDPKIVLGKGTLAAGSGVKVELDNGQVHLRDPSESRENFNAEFDARLIPIRSRDDGLEEQMLPELKTFGLTQDELDRLLVPMIADGKEPIGSMGDTARLAVLSDEPRSLFDYFVQDFAQVTNPPLDYMRESMVTDLTTHLGKRPNIFSPKELIPPTPALTSDSPVLGLGEMAFLDELTERSFAPGLKAAVIDCTFEPTGSGRALRDALDRIAARARDAVERGNYSILILSHREVSNERLPVPSILSLRATVTELNRWGKRLETSIVLEAGDVFTTHQLACCVSFGATAVCPRLALEIARFHPHKGLKDGSPEQREANLISALEQGLLKIMSKMGISVVRSYQSSRLFTAVGIGFDIIDRYFPRLNSVVGGIDFGHIERHIIGVAERAQEQEKLVQTYLFKEHPKGREGEKHSMTVGLSRLAHKAVRAENEDGVREGYQEYLTGVATQEPVGLRHLFRFKEPDAKLPIEDVEPREAITRRFGSGAMSFGAISAESQRDIFKAMAAVGGRSNSGEGGENPYYFEDGTTASTKQIASGRFGVTAEYLVAGNEVEIKIAQGAKPGEGGQLMGIKVGEDIAHARFASPGVDLISPPPLHDIYSIEDLRQLIYELKQLKPGVPVCVKLVAGKNIGTIAAGVVKAGADVIQISGGDGGTGAATVTSMRHAGLPWELGLLEVHQTLLEQELRQHVILRVDGGISTGRDIVLAALLGAEEYGFGKLLLVAQGCIMARVCEKNRCPTGIATHDPKFKKKYKGTPEHVIHMLQQVAEEVRHLLASLGYSELSSIIGRGDLLEIDPRYHALVADRGLELRAFTSNRTYHAPAQRENLIDEGVNPLNARIVADASEAVETEQPVSLEYSIRSTDRAVLARLAGAVGEKTNEVRLAAIADGRGKELPRGLGLPSHTISARFNGSAGQGFAAFLTEGIDVTLYGEANDAVAKSMSGGRVIIRPWEDAAYEAATNVIAGNCVLYGATGGRVFISGLVGDRFAVRNSGALAVVEGAGLHACEYMTGGTVAILGSVSYNVGAGMSGGRLYLDATQTPMVNTDYLAAATWTEDRMNELVFMLTEHLDATGSKTAELLLSEQERLAEHFVCFQSRKELEREARSVVDQTVDEIHEAPAS
ncbi:MAG: glutamate synthase large subunit [Myxococcota bacterium]